MPKLLIRNGEELRILEAQVEASARRAIAQVRTVLEDQNPLRAFAAIKFQHSGFHPTIDRSLNLIEQINQTFTFLASARAAAWLMERYPRAGGFRLNLGTSSGPDVESVDGTIAAETFASVDPRNNKKLSSDIAKVSRTRAAHKYVFYICPDHPFNDSVSASPKLGVKTVSLGWKDSSEK